MVDFLNQLGTPASNLARTMFLQTALLVVALLLFDLLLGRRLRSALRYALWLLVVVKLLLPPSLLLPTGAGFWLGRWFAKPLVVNAPAHYQVTMTEVKPSLKVELVQPTAAPAPPAVELSLQAKLLLVWVAGALLLGLGMILRNQPVRCLARNAGEAPPDLVALLREAAESLCLHRVPALRLSEINHSPALCGFVHPLILLPRELASQLTPDGLRAVMLHELLHLCRRDLWANLLQALVQVLWWWNPIVWLANARIRTLREQAVDEGVMLATQQDRAAYPATLVEVARHCASRPMLALSFLGIFESRRALSSRVDRLLHAPLPQRANLGWSGWTTMLLAGLVALPMAFNRRVEAAPAEEVRVITPSTAATPTSGDGSSPSLAVRRGLHTNTAPTLEANQGSLSEENGRQPAEKTPLFTRQFWVDPDTFIRGLESVLGTSNTNSPTKGGGEITRPHLPTQTHGLVRDFFRAAGVDFPKSDTGASTANQPRKALFFDDRIGHLIVIATAEDLEVIEKAVQALNVAPPQVEVEVKFVEITDGHELTLECESFVVTPDGADATESPTFIGILTDAQFRATLKRLEQRPSVKQVSAPKITTHSGHQAKISVTEAKPIFDPATGVTDDMSFGPVLHLVPVVYADDQSIRLVVTASILEFMGYDSDPPNPPRVRTTQLSNQAALRDGQTLLLCGKIQEGTLTVITGSATLNGIGDVASAVRHFEPAATPTGKRLLVFVTPTIVDPAGNRVVDPNRLPFEPNAKTPQPK